MTPRLPTRALWKDRAFLYLFGIGLGDFRWGVANYFWVAMGGVLWALTGGYIVLLIVGGAAQLQGEADGVLTSTIYIRNVEATFLFLLLGWGPLAVLLNAGRDAAQSLSPTMAGLVCGLAAIVFRLAFLAYDNPAASQDWFAWLLPFPLALFTVMPAATLAQRIYLRRRLAWEREAEAGGSREKPE